MMRTDTLSDHEVKKNVYRPASAHDFDSFSRSKNSPVMPAVAVRFLAQDGNMIPMGMPQRPSKVSCMSGSPWGVGQRYIAGWSEAMAAKWLFLCQKKASRGGQHSCSEQKPTRGSASCPRIAQYRHCDDSELKVGLQKQKAAYKDSSFAASDSRPCLVTTYHFRGNPTRKIRMSPVLNVTPYLLRTLRDPSVGSHASPMGRTAAASCRCQCRCSPGRAGRRARRYHAAPSLRQA